MNNPEIPLTPEQREWWNKAWIALVEDRREFAELAEEILREHGGLRATTIQQFMTCESFLDAEHLEDFDVCFVDADFGYRQMRGFEAVPFIRERKPGMLIIGLTDQPEYLAAFENTQVNLTLRKADLIRSLPRILSLTPPPQEE